MLKLLVAEHTYDRATSQGEPCDYETVQAFLRGDGSLEIVTTNDDGGATEVWQPGSFTLTQWQWQRFDGRRGWCYSKKVPDEKGILHHRNCPSLKGRPNTCDQYHGCG